MRLIGIAFTRNEAPGALRNGTRVEKAESKPEDTHRDGAKATVLGSVGPIPYDGNPVVYGYFVEWDDYPGIAAFIAGNRLREVKQ